MNSVVDLHTHSTASDGSLTPTELVEAAVRLGLSALALTDHDTIDGVSEAMEAGARRGLTVIPGVELSTEAQGKVVHILGYDFDPASPVLVSCLEWARDAREDRNRRMISRLNELDIEITERDVSRLAGGRVIGRPHFAEALVEKGAADSFKEAFVRYLDRGGLAHIPKRRLDPAVAIRVIREAGGVPVLAHPGAYDFSPEELDAAVADMAALGLEGIEVVYPDHTPPQVQIFLDIAIRRKLLPTGGSDYHGPTHRKTRIGQGSGELLVPLSWLAALRERAASRRPPASSPR